MNKIVWMNEQEQDWHDERWQTISVEQREFLCHVKRLETDKKRAEIKYLKLKKKITLEHNKTEKLKLHKSR